MELSHVETQHEIARRQLWINVYTATIEQGHPNVMAKVCADKALKTFDKRFKMDLE